MNKTASPLVSFVVPCYNYGRYLAECLRSIFNQEGNYDFEVIVIDDGSTDNTRQVLAEFTDPRLRLFFHQENAGHAVTINEGLSLARGSFVARIDPDDRYRPCFLSTLVEKFYAYPDIGLVYADAALINENGEVTLEGSDGLHRNLEFKGNEFVSLLETNFICSPTVIAKREAWQKALPVPEWLAFHDWYFTLLLAREYDFCYVNRVVAEYRVHPENHCRKVVKNKTEEPSVMWLLDSIFSQREKTEELEEKKRRMRRTVYGAQYFTLADKYFSLKMREDALRCYLRALRYRPRYIFKAAFLRRLCGVLIGFEMYERGKALIKKLLS